MVIGETERGERGERGISSLRTRPRHSTGRCQSVKPMLNKTSSSYKEKKREGGGAGMTEIKRGFLCLRLSASLPPFSLPLKFWADTNP